MVPGFPTNLKHMPVTKVLTLFNVLIPLVASIMNAKYLFYLSFDPYVFQWKQAWRLFINQLSFSNESQVLFSTILLYCFRVVERHHSSHKYLSKLILIYLYNILFQVVMNLVAKILLPNNLNYLQAFTYATGCFPVIGAVLYDYSTFIPVVYKFEIRDLIPADQSGPQKLVFNDKFFIYVLCIQLAISEWIHSLIPMLSGWIICLLINIDILPGKTWRVPLFMEVYKFLYKNSGQSQSRVTQR